jgi:hypothetical protein
MRLANMKVEPAVHRRGASLKNRSVSIVRILAVIALFLALFVQPCAPTSAANLPEGNVSLSRARGDAQVLWDATPVLAAMIASKSGKEKINNELQADAAQVLVDRAGQLHNAKTLTVIVLYALTGDINPTYNVAVFQGIERYMTVKASIADANKFGPSWDAPLRAGHTPTGLDVKIIGRLPPNVQ